MSIPYNIIPFPADHSLSETTGDARGWRFVSPEAAKPELDLTPDPLHPEFTHVRQLYFLADPGYDGRFTVPVLWDKVQNTIVSNESSEIIRMFNSEFNSILPPRYSKVDLYPETLRSDIDEVNTWTYDTINNGVYKCGIAQNQSAYHAAVSALFSSLDRVEAHLASNSSSSSGPYYFGAHLTELDIRLYVTFIRFDPVYVGLFKTNKKMIRDGYPRIHEYLRRLYWEHEEFKSTTELHHIKHHYFESLVMLNPAGVVPEGSLPDILPLKL